MYFKKQLFKKENLRPQMYRHKVFETFGHLPYIVGDRDYYSKIRQHSWPVLGIQESPVWESVGRLYQVEKLSSDSDTDAEVAAKAQG